MGICKLRGGRDLNEFLIAPLNRTIPYYLEIMNNKQFKEAKFNTSFVDDHPELVNYQSQFPPELMAAAISAAIAAHEGI